MQKLPERIDPWRYAREGRALEGRLPLAPMPRLRSLGVEAGSMEVALAFGIDERRIPHVKGRFRARVTLICQRCLEPFELAIEQPISLGIVASEEQADGLGGAYEPLVVKGRLSLREMLEDEVILALPIIPRHPLEACPARAYLDRDEAPPQSPFAVLQALKE